MCRSPILTLFFPRYRTESVLLLLYKICLTIDIWHSQKNESFLGVTAHFINDEFVMVKYTLALRYLEDSHTGEHIYNVLMNILTEWDIESKVRLH